MRRAGFSAPISALLLALLAASLLAVLPGVLRTSAADGVTVITSLPYSITAPGVYVLESDLYTAGNGILVNSSNVVIRGLGHSIIGSGSGVGVLLDGSAHNLENITVEGLGIEGFEYGIHASYIDSDNYLFTGIVFQDLNISNCGTGIYLEEMDEYNLVIGDTVITNSTYYGIYGEYVYGGTFIVNVTVRGSGVDDYGIYLYPEGYYGVYLYGCEVSGTYWEGIYLDDAEYATIANCWVHDTMDDGIEIYNSYYVLVIRTVSERNSYHGLYADYSSYMWVVDSVFRDNDERGIYIEYSDNIY